MWHRSVDRSDAMTAGVHRNAVSVRGEDTVARHVTAESASLALAPTCHVLGQCGVRIVLAGMMTGLRAWHAGSCQRWLSGFLQLWRFMMFACHEVQWLSHSTEPMPYAPVVLASELVLQSIA